MKNPHKLLALFMFISLIILHTFVSQAQNTDNLSRPVAAWDLDSFELSSATDQISGICDTISNRFHYSQSSDVEVYRYPTYVVRDAEKAPQLNDSFTVAAWIAFNDNPGHWMPILDQGMVPDYDVSKVKHSPGLIGSKYGDSDLSRPVGDEPTILSKLDGDWRDGDSSWSCQWRGYLQAPVTGDVRFYIEADDGGRLTIAGETVIDIWEDTDIENRTIKMKAGEYYPVALSYYRDGGENAYLRIYWEWEGSPKQIVPNTALLHTAHDREKALRNLSYRKELPRETTRLSIGIDSTNRLGIKVRTTSGLEEFYCNNPIEHNEWTHLAVSFKRNGYMLVYVNGESAGTFNTTSQITGTAGGDLRIGSSHREDGKPFSEKVFDGLIANLKIYGKSLVQNEIAEEYRSSINDFKRPAQGIELFKHVIVYDEKGRYAAWPANGGIWQWGDEIAVAFECGWFEDRPDEMDGHATDDRSNEDFLARSTDGGETWTYKKYPLFDPPEKSIVPFSGSMEFTHPGFAFKINGGRFYYSYDRGNTWKGPYRPNVTGVGHDITSRTDYLLSSRDSGLFFMSCEPEGAEDRTFCAITTDGGKTFRFRGWMTESDPMPYERWVMPSTVRLSETHLVSALRRKINIRRSDQPDSTFNWIDVYQSQDNGKTWGCLSRVAVTAVPNEPYNGNPPSLVRLKDGRLCVTYGYRTMPGRICAKLSDDNGRTWGDEIPIRQDARNWDIGYTRTVQRADGKMVTVYYFATPEYRNQCIVATIWDPDVRFVRK